MTCDDCRRDLVFYAGRQLPADEEAAIAAHLATCEECRRELEEERAFARQVHNASTPFRRSTIRIRERLSRAGRAGESRNAGPVRIPARARFAWAARAAGLALFILTAVLIVLRTQDRETDRVVSWAVAHYPLIDQTHPLRGDAQTVRSWFREHHGIDVSPPRRADYSTLAGCKMAEIGSESVPLLRFEGRDTSAVFLLPARYRDVTGAEERTFRESGFTIRVWSEDGNPYLKITSGVEHGS